MTNARTIIITLLAILASFLPPTGSGHDRSAQMPGPSVTKASATVHTAPEPVFAKLTVIGATAEQRQVLDDALVLFDEAGMDLPPLVVEFAATTDACDGHAGLFRRETTENPATITMCHRLPLYLVHELAHAWDHHSLGENARDLALARWGLENWADHDDEWDERGIERAAQTIAYALTLSSPTTNPDILRYVCDYSLLTGSSIPNAELATCDESGSAVSPA